MSLREHIFDFFTRPDIPIRNSVLKHCRLILGLQPPALTDVLHYFEGHRVVKPLLYKIEHNSVTSSYDLGYSTRSCFYKLLCISEPDVRAVSKTGYLQKVCKGFWLCIQKHLLNKSRTHLGYAVSAEKASAYILRSDTERLG